MPVCGMQMRDLLLFQLWCIIFERSLQKEIAMEYLTWAEESYQLHSQHFLNLVFRYHFAFTSIASSDFSIDSSNSFDDNDDNFSIVGFYYNYGIRDNTIASDRFLLANKTLRLRSTDMLFIASYLILSALDNSQCCFFRIGNVDVPMLQRPDQPWNFWYVLWSIRQDYQWDGDLLREMCWRYCLMLDL